MRTERKQVLIACALAAAIVVGVLVGLYWPGDSRQTYKAPKAGNAAKSSNKRIDRDVGQFNLSGPN